MNSISFGATTRSGAVGWPRSRRRQATRTLVAAVSVLVSIGTSFAADGVPAYWPDEWFEPMKVASEVGITEFQQSPYLEDKGLPPVKERLPKDPPVVYPLWRTGKYGGTARIVNYDLWQFFNWEAAFTISADMRTTLPNLAESWILSPDGRTLTIKLREGIRWSDGELLKSDDFLFTFNDLWLNPEYSPVTDRTILGVEIKKIDELTFQYRFPYPNPFFVNFIAQYGDFMIDPSHHFKQYHPTYTDAEIVKERVEEKGDINWMSFVGRARREGSEHSEDVPTLRAFKVVEHSPAQRTYVRNPYYFKVDPEGNQLPYIDVIETEQVDRAELIAAQASTGQLDFSAFEVKTQDIPLLKLGERDGKIKVHIWTRLHSSDVAIQPNYNYEDQRYRDLYWDKRFRHALSYAINRDEMNDIIYFGRGVPRQVTVHPTSAYFKPEYATAHTRYDPEYARELLDEIGLSDTNGDGYREFSDGEPLTITLEFFDFETPKGISMELVQGYWREVGIDLRLKLVDGSLQSARARGGEMQMTLWHADRVTDILFPLFPDWWLSRSISWDRCLWNDWARWYMTSGRLGEEPPPLMKQLQDAHDIMRRSMDPAVQRKQADFLLSTAAENLWVIGTVGLAPHPVVVRTRLKGVPPEGIWGWDNRWTLSYHPATWYIDEEDDSPEYDPKVIGTTRAVPMSDEAQEAMNQ